jgi:type I restriction enzyme S subunit
MTKLVDNTLQSVCTLVTDGTHDTPKVLSEGIPFIKAKQIANGIIDFDDSEFISYEDHLKVISRSKPEKGDTLFAHIGATLGATAFVNTGIEFSIKNVALFKPNPKIINPRYLYYLVISDGFQRSIKNYRTGAAQPFVSLEILRNKPIKYHKDINTQRKIAAILSAYDDLIENNTRRIRILEEMAQTIYREWFVHFRFPGHEGVRMVESEVGLVPEGWEVIPLGHLCRLIKERFDDEKHNQLPLLDLSRMKSGSIAVEATGHSDDLTTSRIVFQENDILFGSIRPYLHKVALAPFLGVTNTSVHVLRSRNKIMTPLSSILLSSERTIIWANQFSTGTKMPVIKWDVFQNMPVALPTDTRLILKFNSIVEPALRFIKFVYHQNRNLYTTRDLLLPKLISGALDVSEVVVAVHE